MRDKIVQLIKDGKVRIEVEELTNKSSDELLKVLGPYLFNGRFCAVLAEDTVVVMYVAEAHSKKLLHKQNPFWDGTPQPPRTTTPSPAKGGCSRKHCRLGDRECDQYWGCRDTCRVVSERITSMDACPQPEA